MEHICFEAQLCSEILIFKEISNIDILIILCLGTSLTILPMWLQLLKALMSAQAGLTGIGRRFVGCAAANPGHNR